MIRESKDLVVVKGFTGLKISKGDGKNDLLRLLIFGIRRMGQFGRKEQVADTYVRMVKAMDYNGNVYGKKR